MYRKEYTERKHVIDFLFPLALFFALAASSVALVVLASGSYSRQVHTSEDSYASCTAPVSYTHLLLVCFYFKISLIICQRIMKAYLSL